MRVAACRFSVSLCAVHEKQTSGIYCSPLINPARVLMWLNALTTEGNVQVGTATPDGDHRGDQQLSARIVPLLPVTSCFVLKVLMLAAHCRLLQLYCQSSRSKTLCYEALSNEVLVVIRFTNM